MARQKNPRKARRKAPRDRFVLYQESVQNPEFEIALFLRIYRQLRGKDRTPRRFREDFCGTALLAAEWVRRVKGGLAQGVDLDRPTLEWGRRHNLEPLGEKARRVELLHGDVREARGMRPDVVAALNFSYFVFKTRKELVDYFRSVRRSLAPDGVFIIDLYGGPEAQEQTEEHTRYDGFTYVWDQHAYNPVTGETLCYIHFEFPGGTRMRRAFTYDWRLWSLPELREALEDAGFAEILVYWEGTDRKSGEGNSVYRRSLKGDDSRAWVAYVAAGR